MNYLKDILDKSLLLGSTLSNSSHAPDTSVSSSSLRSVGDEDTLKHEAVISSKASSPQRSPRIRRSRYTIAQPVPPPKHQIRIKSRPRVHVQLRLQHDSTRRHPAPKWELVSNLSAGRLTWPSKPSTDANDLAILDCQYSSEGVADMPDWYNPRDSHEVVAIIRHPHPVKQVRGPQYWVGAMILTSEGDCWNVSGLPYGGYQFDRSRSVAVDSADDHFSTVRWVPRGRAIHSTLDKRVQQTTGFSFVLMQKNSRQHPVLATLAPTELEIYASTTQDQPVVLGPKRQRSPSEISISSSFEDCPDLAPNLDHSVTQEVLALIAITSLLVCLSEDYVPNTISHSVLSPGSVLRSATRVFRSYTRAATSDRAIQAEADRFAWAQSSRSSLQSERGASVSSRTGGFEATASHTWPRQTFKEIGRLGSSVPKGVTANEILTTRKGTSKRYSVPVSNSISHSVSRPDGHGASRRSLSIHSSSEDRHLCLIDPSPGTLQISDSRADVPVSSLQKHTGRHSSHSMSVRSRRRQSYVN